MGKKDWIIGGVDPDGVYTVKSAAIKTRICPATIRIWIRRHLLPAIPTGGNEAIFTGEDLAAIMRARKFFGAADAAGWRRSLASLHKARHRKLHPERERARQWVTQSLKRGALKRGPCEVCNSPVVEAHHDDYNKPARVRWFCREHHHEHHGPCNGKQTQKKHEQPAITY